MSDAPASAPGRPMKFPYTMTAKIAQFPMKHHYNKVWWFRYWFVAMGVCIPLFYKIGQASYSPANVRRWEEIRRQAFTPGHH